MISSTEMHTLHGGVKRRGTTIYFIEEKQPTNLDLLLNYLFIENKNSFQCMYTLAIGKNKQKLNYLLKIQRVPSTYLLTNLT